MKNLQNIIHLYNKSFSRPYNVKTTSTNPITIEVTPVEWNTRSIKELIKINDFFNITKFKVFENLFGDELCCNESLKDPHYCKKSCRLSKCSEKFTKKFFAYHKVFMSISKNPQEWLINKLTEEQKL